MVQYKKEIVMIYEILPSEHNTRAINEAIYKAQAGDTVKLIDADYYIDLETAYVGDVYPSNNDGGVRTVPIYIKDKHGITLDGGGAKLIFSGKISPIVVDNCSDFVMKNFTIDFVEPQVHQGTVIESNEEYIEFEIDPTNYPYRVEGKDVYWQVGDVEIPSNSIYIFDYDNDSETGRRNYIMAHFAIGKYADEHVDSEWSVTNNGTKFPRYLLVDAEEKTHGILRLNYRPNSSTLLYPKGSRILFHLTEGDRLNDTVFTKDCQNILYEDIIIRRGPTMGFITQLTRDMTLRGCRIEPDRDRGDLLTTTADSVMFVDAMGDILIDKCYISCSLDDGLNVHSTYLGVNKVEGNRLLLNIEHKQQKGYNPMVVGHKVAFFNTSNLRLIEGEYYVTSSKLLEDKFHIEVTLSSVPEGIDEHYNIVNMTTQPNITVQDTEYYRSTCILIATAGKAIFRRNKVHTIGDAIHVVDEPGKWHEAGLTRDCTIEDNEFYRCGEWSDGYLLRVVERHIERDLAVAEDFVHKNIVFRNNKIVGRNSKIFHACSVDGLVIEGNAFVRDRQSKFRDSVPYVFVDCKDVKMSGNSFEF